MVCVTDDTRADTRCVRGASDVTSADIIKISRTLALEPWHFTQTSPSGADDPAGIVLDSGRRRVALGLATAAHGCVFLVRTLSGEGLCGLGELAPVSCRHGAAEPEDMAHWQETIARWNAMSKDDGLTVEEFQRYMLEAEAAREDGAPWPEEVSA